MTGVEVECDLNISNFCSLSCTLIFMIDGPSIGGNILLKNTLPICNIARGDLGRKKVFFSLCITVNSLKHEAAYS